MGLHSMFVIGSYITTLSKLTHKVTTYFMSSIMHTHFLVDILISGNNFNHNIFPINHTWFWKCIFNRNKTSDKKRRNNFFSYVWNLEVYIWTKKKLYFFPVVWLRCENYFSLILHSLVGPCTVYPNYCENSKKIVKIYYGFRHDHASYSRKLIFSQQKMFTSIQTDQNTYRMS